MLSAHATLTAAALGDELTESEASLRVFLTAGGLAILGLCLLLFTIWWWRGTRPEPPALAPLEVMSDRRWQTASDHERMRMIDEYRPDGAFGLNGRPAPVPIDLSVLARDLPSGFDDLRDDPALWPAEQPSLMQSSLAELLEGVGDTAVDEHSADDASGDVADEPAAVESSDDDGADSADDHAATVAADDLDGADEADEADADATMFQVEAPRAARPTANGQHNGVQGDSSANGQADELVIDPLLQRTASQD